MEGSFFFWIPTKLSGSTVLSINEHKMWHFSFVFLTMFFTKSFWKAKPIYCRLLSLWGSNLTLSEQTWSCGKWFCANFSPGTKSLSAPVEVQFCQNKVFSQNLKTTRKLKQKVFEYIFRLAGKGELASPASAPYKWELEICWTKSTKKLQEIPTRNGSRSPGPRPGAQPRQYMEKLKFRNRRLRIFKKCFNLLRICWFLLEKYSF